VAHAVGSEPFSEAIGDVDLDGLLDIVTANRESNDVSVLLGTGGGSFAAARDVEVGSTPESIAIADLDQDGLPDLAVANEVTANSSVMLGRGDGTFEVHFF